MSGLITQGDSIATAKDMKEAVAPLIPFDVICIVHTKGTVRVMAKDMQEAAAKVATMPGVIHPLGVRVSKTEVPANG